MNYVKLTCPLCNGRVRLSHLQPFEKYVCTQCNEVLTQGDVVFNDNPHIIKE